MVFSVGTPCTGKAEITSVAFHGAVFLENDVVAVLTVVDFSYFITCQCGIEIVVILPVTGTIGVAPVTGVT